MSTDSDLLRQFANHRDEVAFAELVRRHADFVYSVALRVTCNGALAQDVTQSVFTTLAKQAGKLQHYETLLGWLHTTTRHLAINAVRGEARRRAREQEATAMQNINSAPETNWAEIGPLLDEAVGQLKETDRDAVLLRFFKNLSHQEVGAALGLGEDAARKRVDRALEKLREHFARRGVTASSAILTSAILGNSVQAAPLGLVAQATTAALTGVGGVAIGGTSLLSLFTFFMSTKTKTILAMAVVLALAATLAIKLSRPTESSNAPEPQSITAQGTALVPKVVALPSPSVSAQVAAPKVQPAPAITSVAAATTTAEVVPDSPRLHLDTAMNDFLTMLQTGDYKTALETYFQIPPTLSAEDFVLKLQQNPDFPNTLKMLIDATSAARTIPPVYDDTGNLATYSISPPVDGKTLVRWKKIDGKWFVDAFE
jgi:RNA polymerase sigma factor (sigma-70 family)